MGKKNKKKFKAAQQIENTSTASKKEAVLGGGKSGGNKSTFIGLGIALLIVAIVGFVIFGGGTGASPFKAVTAEAGMVKIPISEVNDGQSHHYTYKGNKTINFFVLRSSDGVIRAAFDACDVCYLEKKGYRQEGDTMVCNNCGQRFPSTKINVIKGGCNPAPLNRSVEGDYLVLRTADIETGAFYF
jgi:uncharacterized membrane protein